MKIQSKSYYSIFHIGWENINFSLTVKNQKEAFI